MTDAPESAPVLPGFLYSRAIKPILIAGLFIYFFYMVVSKTPANVAAWAVHQAAPNLWLTSVQGTLWVGNAGGAQVDVADQSIPLGQVSWSLNPWTLLILKPCLSFETEVPGQMISGHFCQSPFGTASLEDLVLEIPISVINDLLPIETAGQLSINVLQADMNGQQVNSLDARFSWQNASVYNGEAWLGLGSFGGQAQANGDGGIQARLFDLSGPFGLDLNAGWAPGTGNWIATGTVTTKPGAPRQAIQALQIIGEEVESGTYKISWP